MKFSIAAAVLTGLALVGNAVADCECGYSVNATDSEHYAVFTDLLESDFTSLSSITADTDWRPQEWKMDALKSRGQFGRSTEVENVISNPEKKKGSGIGKNGGEAGLELWARAPEAGDEHVRVGEVASSREDIIFASIRAGIKPTTVNGTCGAFFWYFNDTQEIDMELLSREFNQNKNLNLVLHSPLSLSNGGDASTTPTFQKVEIGFNPSDTFHEYRFDWTKEYVAFFIDGKRIAVFTQKEFIPSVPGKIILSHWSNGEPSWSAGPPAEDAKMVVSYVKAYFNSSDPDRQKKHQSRCKGADGPNTVCLIPDQLVPPRSDVATEQEGKPYFFSQDPLGDKVKGQLVYGNTAATKTGMSFLALAAGLGASMLLF
ncbi:concanavalin A-like lectin/glucanase [Ascobolus immersus RN42]|uniref:Concanavalin A-like lectin/glucanase n=1 Tax=Ascobolus immersus RN42 TaxID=1160509 RepID=A0A3N4HR76_ASCIM|nr:concanavalin A-like lectin/glucanase [Ascobolus immersus RN42]